MQHVVCLKDKRYCFSVTYPPESGPNKSSSIQCDSRQSNETVFCSEARKAYLVREWRGASSHSRAHALGTARAALQGLVSRRGSELLRDWVQLCGGAAAAPGPVSVSLHGRLRHFESRSHHLCTRPLPPS